MRVAGVAEYCDTVKDLPRYEGGSERGAAWGVLFPFWELFFDTCAQKWFAIHAEHDKISEIMMIHVITTDADYEAALARVEAIFGAESGSPEFDELEVWGTLIEAYEREHHPIAPPTPLEAIEFAMDQQGLKRQDLCHE